MTPACLASCSCEQLGSKGRSPGCIHGARTCDITHRGRCLTALPCFQTTQTQVLPGRDPPRSGGIAPSSVYLYTPPGCKRGVNHRPLDFIQQKCGRTLFTSSKKLFTSSVSKILVYKLQKNCLQAPSHCSQAPSWSLFPKQAPSHCSQAPSWSLFPKQAPAWSLFLELVITSSTT